MGTDVQVNRFSTFSGELNSNCAAQTVEWQLQYLAVRLRMAWVTDIDSLYDFIGLVVLSAPDDFEEEDFLGPDEQLTLERAFQELRNGVDLIDPEMIDDSKRRFSNLLAQISTDQHSL